MPILSASGGSVMPGPVRIYTEFEQTPIIAKSAGAGAATGTAADVNILLMPNYGLLPAAGFEYFIIGTQTIVAPPVIAAGGLEIGMDQTDNDGVQFDNGITARNPVAFTVGTDPACYVKATFTIADASGASPLVVGFRKVAARAADYNDWTDFAVIGDYEGDIKIETALNNAATVTTDTTDNWADAATKKLAVFVSSAGVVTYQVDDAAPTVVAAYTFDNGDQIMPVVLFMQGSDVSGSVLWSLFDAGAQ
jgi:hypothetical protein